MALTLATTIRFISGPLPFLITAFFIEVIRGASKKKLGFCPKEGGGGDNIPTFTNIFLEAPLNTSMKKAVMKNGRGPLINLMVVAKVSATVITCMYKSGDFSRKGNEFGG